MLSMKSPEMRLHSRLRKDYETGCWLWTGSRNGTGYGQIWLDGTMVGTHRFSYEIHIGPIPENMTLDHLCRVRHCFNPRHLEVATHRTNILRGTGATARNARKTRCKNGHLFDESNTYWRAGRTKRRCRECHRL